MPEGGARASLPLAAGLRPRRPRPPRSRRLGWSAAVSAVLHAALIALLLFALAHRKRLLNAAETPAIVELVMTPPGGSHNSAPATSPAPTKARLEAKPAPPAQPAPKPTEPAPKAPAPNPAMVQPPTQPTPQPAAPAVPAPAPGPTGQTTAATPPQPAATPAAPSPAQRQAQVTTPPRPAASPQPTSPAKPALQLSLGGIASDTNALVTGSMLLPPTVNPTYHNRKPSYPPEAARLGQHGAVVLLIHVAADGTVLGVDIAESSGFPLLDRSARDTVLTWHFLPALRDGHPAPFDMPMRIQFDLN